MPLSFPTPLTSGQQASSPRPRVLWADDNADMRDYVGRLLSNRYHVETVANGEEALAAARARPPDLLLAAVMMPRLDGLGLLRALRADARTSTIPAILLSARADEESRLEGLAAGADDYLVKPFSARELLGRIGTHLEMNQLRQETSRREQALLADTQAAQQRLETVLQAISDGFIALDRDWRYVALNEQACESMGMRRHEILGRRIWDLFPDTIGTRFETEMRRAASQQQTIVFDFLYPTRNRWYENRLYPSADGLTILFADVTERKRAEEALTYRALLLENVSDAIVAADERLIITAWNSAAEEIYGWKSEEVLGRDVRDVVRSEYPERDRDQGFQILAETGRFHAEVIHHRKDGTPFWIEGNIIALRDAAMQTAGYVYTYRDVTERRQADAALRASEERFRALAENVPLLVWTCTPEQQCDYVNPQVSRYTGFPHESLLGPWRLDLIYPDDHAGMRTAWERGMSAGVPVDFEHRMRRHDGVWRWFQVTAVPLREADGQIVKWLGTSTDIDDRKQAEAAMRLVHDELEGRVAARAAELKRANTALRREVAERRRAEAARTELLRRLVTAQEDERRRVAHDIHDGVTQLAAAAALHLDESLSLQTDLAGEPLHELERARDLARQAATESRRLIAGLRPEALDDFGLVGVLRQEVEALRAAGWPATFQEDASANERLTPEVEITLYRVAQEALLNVRKHTHFARVRVRLGRIDAHVQLEVRDWGSGFDPERARDGAAAGQRVGVAGMRERLVLLGGRLEVRSRKGYGTTVRATLPLASPA